MIAISQINRICTQNKSLLLAMCPKSCTIKTSSCPYFIKLLRKDTLRSQSVQENFNDNDDDEENIPTR